MRRRRLWWGSLLVLLLLARTGCGGPSSPEFQEPVSVSEPRAPLRLFVIYSYDTGDVWTGQIRTGLLESLARAGYLFADGSLVLGEFALRSHTTTALPVAEATEAARAFDPLIIVTIDDEAAGVIATYPDRDQLFVFCGVNQTVDQAGLDSDNVTGVLERPYALETIRMALRLLPDAETALILGDSAYGGASSAGSLYWQARADETLGVQLQRVETLSWDVWRATVETAGSEGFDFVVLGHYSGLVDDAGSRIAKEEVLEWTLLASETPVFALWQDAVTRGAVGGLVLSPYEQGITAGQLVIQISRGAHPSSLLAARPERNLLAMNLAAAQHWDLQVPLEILLAASIGGTFPDR
ncbi:MAG: hypothetical protein JXB35_02295 [Anaerolineae bacterium]|nr:hypothetical protein [Anaerolineae bacterium]